MKLLLKYLKKKYGIRIDKNDKINGTEFIVCFNIDYDIESHEDSDIKNDGTYITPEFCKDIIMQNKIKELIPKLIDGFTCKMCDEVFLEEASLKKHLSRKKSCNTLICKICNSKCTSTRAMNAHLKTKKHIANINIITYNNNGNGNVNANANANANNVNGNNNTVINNPVIILNCNDILNTIKLTEEQKTKILNASIHKIIPDMVAMIHFDKNKPECQNVRYTNRQSKNAFVFSDGKWMSEKVKYIAEDLLLMHGYGLKDILKKYGVNLPEEKIKKIEEFVDLLFGINVKNTINGADYVEASKKFTDNKQKQIERMINTLYDETQRMKLKNPLKE